MPAQHPIDGLDCSQSLTLDLRTQDLWRNALLNYQDSRLELCSEGTNVILSHYFERYTPTNSQWMEYSYKVPLTELVHWIMASGQLSVERSGTAPWRGKKQSGSPTHA
ncbi:hypothetical protein KC131_15575 [Pseudomonas sp. JQ170]|uniref:hypothetical protein n=1 Tax=unclassified Pseudomonas TaxID=196821 RepID=UPI0026519251|nr:MULTISPECIES: hypothetical protein [unclassified Pseudomonas]MDN7142066.1 hypothetical protein [Pseudomonas sp. JQ170]WRO78007.1 hypothetical protein U9R80_10160 [Pseudomonas sp. 170C]